MAAMIPAATVRSGGRVFARKTGSMTEPSFGLVAQVARS